GQHSGCHYSVFTHMPGLKTVVPSTPADAKGLLTACIRDDDPCVFIEPAALYGATGPVPAGEHLVPLGKADVKRPGADVTLITYGRQVHDCLGVAAALEGEIDVEVLDLRSLVPWDAEAMLGSVSKTRRAVVVHQAVRRCGVGAEIAAFLSEELWGTLLAPVLRVAAKDTPVPYAKELEDHHLPSAADITEAVRAVAHQGGER
ncbi:MAG: alpha-ketoacid dehydrogenase subunit beta, partial [Acidimicrobiia bacterium]